MRPHQARGVALTLWVAALLATVVNAWIYVASYPRSAQLTRASTAILTAVGTVVIASLGSFVASRRPENRTGWLLAVLGPLVGFGGLAETYAKHALIFDPGSLPGGRWVAWIATWLFPSTFWLPIILLLLWFPTGKFLSRRWTVVAWVAFINAAVGGVHAAIAPGPMGDFKVTNPAGAALGGYDLVERMLSPLADVYWLVTFVCVIVAASSLVFRYRRSVGIERQQMKWLALSGAFTVIGGVLLLALTVFNIESGELGPILFGAGLASIPLTTSIAILRYRLYDIDVVINKTFVYGALAAFITLIYVGVVVGVGSLVGAGGEPNLGLSLLATGLVAVAFQPVRERIQRIANRIVYGQRLSPYEAVTNFSHRMAESLSFEEILPSVGQAASNAVGGERAKVKLIFPQGGSEEIYWPPTGTDYTQNSFDATVNVVHQGERVGEIQVAKKKGEALSPQEHKLLSDLASQAGLAFSNLRLTEELKAKLIELQESRRRIVSAQDEERRRMERDIHDGAQQQLVSVSVKLGLARSLLAKDPTKAQSMLEELKTEASEAVETLRDLARGLFPPVLTERGLEAALRSHAEKAGLDVDINTTPSALRFDPKAEAAVYFAIREALQNASKHAPNAQISISLTHTDGVASFHVRDNGPGFEVTKAKRGSGLQNMRDRLEALGGKFAIDSTPGVGTHIGGSVPVSAGVANHALQPDVEATV